MSRTIIVGGPSRGKSTTAHEMWENSGRALRVFCGDPLSKVRFSKPYTVYLPEGLDFAGNNGAAAWIVENWLPMAGPWVLEGHVFARVLRRYRDLALELDGTPRFPCDRVIVLDRPAHRATSKGQEAMHTGVMKVWDEIEEYYAPISVWLR